MGLRTALGLARSLPDLLAAASPLTNPTPQVASPFAPYPNHLNSVVWPDLIGVENLPLQRAEAMTVPAVARARRLLCATVARLPMHAYRGDDLLGDQPRWTDRTDGPLSPFHRLLWTMDDLMFYGWSLWGVRRDFDGVVIAADRVAYDRWSFDAAGRIEVDGELVADSSVILIPGLDEGLLVFAARTIRHASALIRAATVAAETPSAQLELHQTNDAPMTDDDISQLVSAWAAARRGTNGGVAYTNSGIEVKEHGAASEHLLIEGRNAAAVDVARAAGIPASLIDATGPSASLNYETASGRNVEFVDYGLAPYLSAISARLGMDDMVPRGVRIQFDLSDFTSAAAGPVSVQDDDARPNTLPASAPTNGPSPLSHPGRAALQPNERN